ncbi:MAG: hypothetical protein ICV70_03820 [Jiangellaceae bacterium]|nr:hypothetical protein [Jiangellaceae bacterium]
MDVHDQLDELETYVQSVRALPMLSYVVANRPELLAKLAAVRGSLPKSLKDAETLLAERAGFLAQAEAAADRVVAAGRAEHARLVSEQEVLSEARHRGEQAVADAMAMAERIRQDADEYVDAKLAQLEVAAVKIVDTVRRGREQLRHTSAYQELAAAEDGLGGGEVL